MIDLQSLVLIISNPAHIACFILGFLSALALKWSPKFLYFHKQTKAIKKDLKKAQALHKQSLEELQAVRSCLENKEKEIKVLQNKLYTRVKINSFRL